MVAHGAEAQYTRGVDGERHVHPAFQAARVARLVIVAAGEDREARVRLNRSGDHLVGEMAAGVAGHDNIARADIDGCRITGDERIRPRSRGHVATSDS